MKKLKFVFTTLAVVITANANAAIQFTDFTNVPILQSGIGNPVESFFSGYQMAQQAARMQQEQRQLELYNKIMEEQLRTLKKAHR